MLSPLFAALVMHAGLVLSPLALDLVGPAPVTVQDPNAPATIDGMLSACAEVREFARVAMQVRQEGAAMGDLLLALALGSETPADRHAMSIVVEAWEEPQWHTDEIQADAINRFAVEAESNCIRLVQAGILPGTESDL